MQKSIKIAQKIKKIEVFLKKPIEIIQFVWYNICNIYVKEGNNYENFRRKSQNREKRRQQT